MGSIPLETLTKKVIKSVAISDIICTFAFRNSDYVGYQGGLNRFKIMLYTQGVRAPGGAQNEAMQRQTLLIITSIGFFGMQNPVPQH